MARAKAREQSVFRGAQGASCRAQEPFQLPSVRCAWTLGGRGHLSQECQERRYTAATGARISDYRKRNIRFRPCITRRRYVLRCHSPGRPCTPRCQRHPGGDTSEGTARCATTAETTACHSFTASTDTPVRWRMQRIQSSRHERNG